MSKVANTVIQNDGDEKKSIHLIFILFFFFQVNLHTLLEVILLKFIARIILMLFNLKPLATSGLTKAMMNGNALAMPSEELFVISMNFTT